MNTMLNSNTNLRNNFLQFAREIRQSGKNPEAMLNELISSGKVSKEDVEKAKQKASSFLPIIKEFIK